jgi:hypothetical protein
MKLWLGYSRNQKYEIEEAGNYETLERRVILMGTFFPAEVCLNRHVLKLSFLMTRTAYPGPYPESEPGSV